MKDDVKGVLKTFGDSGIIGKILITFVVLFVLFISVFVWYNVQNTKVLTEFVKQNRNVEKLIENQAKLDLFKKCIKEAYDEAEREFNTEMLVILGETMQEFNVPFPQELNKAILKYREIFTTIKDCLIFPEKL